ncbi:MAG TPA: F0F1 ATP synthase subunit epsilon [Vicinamibacteria bacterium]|jgi:F-type H+-transporting ATPase subunit epsilon|nr:F0F1 ATP synthase subunit epsilon [Vicinamibacteria bacterium]
MVPLPSTLALEIVTPEGLLLRDEVEEVIAPGEEGYFGVRPGHTPLLATLGMGEFSYRKDAAWHRLTCFSGWCEVLPDRVNVLADIGERAEDIDVGRAELALKRAAERMRAIRDEAGYEEAHLTYVRAVTRLAVARRERGGV